MRAIVVWVRAFLRSVDEIFYRLRLEYGYRVWGIDFVAHQLSRVPAPLIPSFLRRYGASVGGLSWIVEGIQINNAGRDRDSRGDFSNLIIGENCFVGKGTFFDLPERIVLEDESLVGAGACILTHCDCGNRPLSQWYPRKKGPVVIGKGTFLGINAIILPGVTLGRCCVVAAGSVVTESFPDRSVVVGVPARLVKRLPAERGDDLNSS